MFRYYHYITFVRKLYVRTLGFIRVVYELNPTLMFRGVDHSPTYLDPPVQWRVFFGQWKIPKAN